MLRVFLAGTLVAITCACSAGQTTSTPTVGDTCLVGTWVLQQEDNPSGYTYGGVTVSVTGLKGARMEVSTNGTETETFDGSAPLVGTTTDGRVLSITISGSLTFHVHAAGGEYGETGTRTVLAAAATIGGAPIAGYQAYHAPSHGTYSCSQQTLTTTVNTRIQTVTWSRG